MRAVIRRSYGGTEVVEVVDNAPIPIPGAGEVRLRVHAAGVDPGVWHVMSGLPIAARLAFGLRTPRSQQLGMDVSGSVEVVGPGVTKFVVGDEVFGIGRGTFAEFAIAPVAKLARRPENLSTEAAAVLSISGLTALQSVRDAGGVHAGQRVLVLGAAGGVGSYTVQIAAALGAVVTGVASGGKEETVRRLGAAEFVDYTRGEPVGQWDLIIDTAGHRRLRDVRAMLSPRGTLVLVGAEGGGNVIGGLDRTLAATAASPFTTQRLRGFFSTENAADLAVLADLTRNGKVAPLVGARFPLERAADAIDLVHAGHATGKTVLVT